MRSMINASEDEMTAEFWRECRNNSARVSGSMDENVRLLLQHLRDNPGTSGIPMWLERTPECAENLGFLQITWPSGGGMVCYKITSEGAAALDVANSTLGEKATRYVYEVKYFGDLKPVVYGYPFQWPLNAPTRRIDGTLVADRRPIAKAKTWFDRLFG